MHTVLPHPRDPARLLVAMSTGGVYRSEDAGASWAPGNTGIRAYFMPDEWPEFGQCVHKVARDSGNPERLYAQNHHGVYRSDDDGRTWSSIADGLPSDFGFPMVAHPGRSGVVWTFPLVADGERFPTDHRCRVFRSVDAGGKWEPLSVGCPRGRSIRRCSATRCAPTTAPRVGSTSAPAPARSSPAATRATPGPWWRRTCPTCSASGPGGLIVVTVLLPGPLRGRPTVRVG
ncbi:hypothetical protein NKG94_17865 [Micromonospora sp. M12]